jgi:quercetin dioxygenase-like cupin family protein
VFLFTALRALGFSQGKPKISLKTHRFISAKVSPCRINTFGAAKEEKLMTTKNDPAATERSVAAEHNSIQFAAPAAVDRRGRLGLRALAATAMVAALAFGQVSPLQIIPLAQGYSPDHEVELHIKGPTDVLQTDLIFQPGGTTGWHIHPGPVVVVVKSGALTEIHSNGCITVHPAGSAFFEAANDVHNVVNQAGMVTDVYATFLSPAGSNPLIPVPDPGGVCRNNGHDH